MGKRSRARSRQAAENRVAHRRERAQSRARARRVDEASLQRALQRSALPPDEALDAVFEAVRRRHAPPQEARYAALYGVLVASAETRRINRYRSLLLRLLRDAPRLVHGDWFEATWMLCACRWTAPLAAWVPAGRGAAGRFRSLVDHLVVEYPTPAFLRRSLFLPPSPDAERAVALFCHLAQGGSLRKRPKGLLPTPLTKTMTQAFMTMRGDVNVFGAVRAAQVSGRGGTLTLAGALQETPLGRGFQEDEGFWDRCIRWFCAQDDLDRDDVAPLVDFVAWRRRDERSFELKGRSARALVAAMHGWHRELALSRSVRCITFTPSGIQGNAWTDKDVAWSTVELLGTHHLAAEGKAMRHCVLTYNDVCKRRRTAIFSLRRGSERALTLEVDLSRRAVVQARGRYNRTSKPDEASALQRWAAENGLRVRL
jgi:hypothetical protein